MPAFDSNILDWHRSTWQSLVADKPQWPHAVLLKGNEGIGKLLFAQQLAKGLLCEKSVTMDACGSCTGCRWMACTIHPDFKVMTSEVLADETDEKASDKAKKPRTQILIEQIRELSYYINIGAQRTMGKVVLLHPAEALNANAANALLKMLEEPPPQTFFLLVSHGPQKLLPTLMSRCRQIGLPAPAASDALTWLVGQGAFNPELSLAQAGGAPLRAAELDGDGDYWQQRSVLLRHLTAVEFDALAAADEAHKMDGARVLDWLHQWVYDLVFLKMNGKIRYHLDCAGRLTALSNRLESVNMLRYFRELSGQRRIVDHPLNARLFIEQLMLSYSRLLRPSSDD